ncbi:MAG: hypothetical protein PHP46_00975 [Candidatus Omnitrophica bacterium]|nr:hypothetical protein [Candidatus Omnitrophota bacterium]
MVILVKSIGALIIFVGALCILNPQAMKGLLSFWKAGKRVYAIGIIRLVFGILFLIAAPQCKEPWLIRVFGVLMLLSAFTIFFMGLEKIKGMFEWFDKRPLSVIRILALVAFVIGALIAYSA